MVITNIHFDCTATVRPGDADLGNAPMFSACSGEVEPQVYLENLNLTGEQLVGSYKLFSAAQFRSLARSRSTNWTSSRRLASRRRSSSRASSGSSERDSGASLKIGISARRRLDVNCRHLLPLFIADDLKGLKKSREELRRKVSFLIQ